MNLNKRIAHSGWAAGDSFPDIEFTLAVILHRGVIRKAACTAFLRGAPATDPIHQCWTEDLDRAHMPDVYDALVVEAAVWCGQQSLDTASLVHSHEYDLRNLLA